MRLLVILLVLFFANPCFAAQYRPDYYGYGTETEGPYANLASIAAGPTVTFTAPNTITCSTGWSGFVAGDTISISGSANNNRLFMIDSISVNDVTTIHGNVTTEASQTDVAIDEKPTIVVVNSSTWTTDTTVTYSEFTSGEKTTRSSGNIPVIATSLKKAWAWQHNNYFILFELSGDFAGSGSTETDYSMYTLGKGIWIAGQTAPSPGPRVKNVFSWVNGDDTIVEHVRFRQGDISSAACGGTAALAVHSDRSVENSQNRVVIAHVDITWGVDETLSISSSSEIQNVTVTHSIIGEGMYDPTTCAEMKGGAFLMYQTTTNKSILDNLIANSTTRTPEMQSGGGTMLFANNLIYNAREPRMLAAGSSSAYTVDYIGNVARRYNRTGVGGELDKYFLWFEAEYHCYPNSQFYLFDNMYGHGETPSTQADADDWGGGTTDVRMRDAWQSCWADFAAFQTDVSSSTSVLTHPTGWTNRGSSNVYDYITDTGKVGAWASARDDAGTRMIDETIARASTLDYSSEPQAADLDWGTLAANTEAVDAKSNPIPSDPHADDDSDGYTNLEEWLHDLADRAEGVSPPTASNVQLMGGAIVQ